MTTIEQLQQELRNSGMKATLRAQKNPLAGGVVNVQVAPDMDTTFEGVHTAICSFFQVDPQTTSGRKAFRLLDERYAEMAA